jgi:hypothetical protein
VQDDLWIPVDDVVIVVDTTDDSIWEPVIESEEEMDTETEVAEGVATEAQEIVEITSTSAPIIEITESV